MTDEPQDRLIPVKEVSYLLGISKTSVYELAGKGEIPKPRKFGERMARWRLSDIQAVIDSAPRAGKNEGDT